MQRDLRRMADRTFDLLVVGAGIYGAIAAWDAAARGLAVALIDKGDFGSGTSFNSLKTLHGGLRSLQALDLRQMRLFIRERRAMARIAPHLVRVLPCVVPTYRSLRLNAGVMQAALAINDLVARDRNEGLQDPRLEIPSGYLIARDECLALNPTIDSRGVTGGAVWHDYQMTSADRMTLAFVQSASRAGAAVANYIVATRFLGNGRRIEGVSASDPISGTTFDIRARVVLNAAGPWAASLLDTLPDAARATPAPRLSRAMNLVTRPFLRSHASGALVNGRFLFAAPWGHVSIIGTSHDPHDGGPDLRVTRAQADALLAEARQAFPGAALTDEDIRLVHRGLLPMVSADNGHVKLLRESVVVRHRAQGIAGLVSIFGVRYTTARQTAEDAVDAVFGELGYPLPPPCRTHLIPVEGGDVPDLNALVQRTSAAVPGLPESVARRLVVAYGTRAQDVATTSGPAVLAWPLSDACEITGAEILYAVRSEGAVTLADAVVRRTGAGSAGHPGMDALSRAGTIMGDELGWTDARRHEEIGAVDAFYSLPE